MATAFVFPGKSSARWRLFWRWLHVGRFRPPSMMEAALAAWPDMLWAGPPGTLPRALLPTARRRQWARAVLAAVASPEVAQMAAELAAAVWVEWRLAPTPTRPG